MSESPVYTPPPSKGQAGVDPYSIPLDQIDPSDPELFETDTLWKYFDVRSKTKARLMNGSGGMQSGFS